jgi:hypothetical protein
MIAGFFDPKLRAEPSVTTSPALRAVFAHQHCPSYGTEIRPILSLLCLESEFNCQRESGAPLAGSKIVPLHRLRRLAKPAIYTLENRNDACVIDGLRE